MNFLPNCFSYWNNSEFTTNSAFPSAASCLVMTFWKPDTAPYQSSAAPNIISAALNIICAVGCIRHGSHLSRRTRKGQASSVPSSLPRSFAGRVAAPLRLGLYTVNSLGTFPATSAAVNSSDRSAAVLLFWTQALLCPVLRRLAGPAPETARSCSNQGWTY